jgi:hypothetical protein
MRKFLTYFTIKNYALKSIFIFKMNDQQQRDNAEKNLQKEMEGIHV